MTPGAASTGWKTTLPHGLRSIAGTGELEYYSDPSVGTDPFSVQDGVLDITASVGGNTAGKPYTSGIITTQFSFAQLYGYFDIVAQLPAGQGMWPAFWLLPANGAGTQEIDVFEEYGRNPTQYSASLHSPSSGISSAAVATTDLTQGFHDYGVYWTPSTLSYYLDGVQVAVARTPSDMNTPMYMLANLAISKDVSADTFFPATLQIASISAYAYDSSVPGPVAPLLAVVPASATTPLNQAMGFGNVAIADPAASSDDVLTVTLSDKSLGILSVTAAPGAAVLINHGWQVTLSGTLDSVNATLASLTYKNVPTDSAQPSSDTITLTASDPDGDFDSARITVALTQSATPVQFVTLGSQPARVAANGHDVFVVQEGTLPDPALNQGQVDHIVGFHTDDTTTGSSDFMAFHGFDAYARLVFDHYAAPGGVVDMSMQYYRVNDASGSSPIFMVQMANHSGGMLGSADYGFYPS